MGDPGSCQYSSWGTESALSLKNGVTAEGSQEYKNNPHTATELERKNIDKERMTVSCHLLDFQYLLVYSKYSLCTSFK